MRSLRRREQGKPAAALAIIATIFAIALIIRVLPPATLDGPLPVALGTLPARAPLMWSTNPAPVLSTAVRLPTSTLLERRVALKLVEAPSVETTAELQLTFESDPGDAPVLPAAAPVSVALPMAVAAVPAEVELGDSPLASSFMKTRSALRMAFVKTGNAIKTAASGTAGVFVSNP